MAGNDGQSLPTADDHARQWMTQSDGRQHILPLLLYILTTKTIAWVAMPASGLPFRYRTRGWRRPRHLPGGWQRGDAYGDRANRICHCDHVERDVPDVEHT